jgi:hypothetical protein
LSLSLSSSSTYKKLLFILDFLSSSFEDEEEESSESFYDKSDSILSFEEFASLSLLSSEFYLFFVIVEWKERG